MAMNVVDRDQQLVDECPDEHGEQKVLLLLKVVRLDLLKDEVPHILHGVKRRVSAFADVKPRRLFLLTVLFDSLADVIIFPAFFDLDWSTI